ncbi:MAG: hypothetical protein Q4A55_07630 [Aerococcus sp.]|nr:hypothetical protein [Aerococcus sp.]
MADKGIAYLKRKLANYQLAARKRYDYYDMHYQELQRGVMIPPEVLYQYRSCIGWCSKAVDALADRLVFREFINDELEMNEIFQMNSPDVFFDSAILSALISSCCFVYISLGEDDMPRLQVIEGTDATGVIDPITGLLTEGYAVLERDDNGNPILEAYFQPHRTSFYSHGELNHVTNHKAPYALLVPIIHRPDAKRPFGRSRITRACMYYQAYAKRTLERSDVSAEFYSFPQKYIVGLSQDTEFMDTWRASISSMLAFEKDNEGDSPKLGQFQQQSMAPYLDQLRAAASGFAGESGLTLDDLGFPSDNPSSAEAIKASHETLRVTARKAQRCFGTGFLNVGYLAVCLRDDYEYERSLVAPTKPKWEPVFEADAATMSVIGDGAIKINQAVPGYMDKDAIRDLTGLEGGNGGYSTPTVGSDQSGLSKDDR